MDLHKSLVIIYITRLTQGKKAEYNNFRGRVKWLRSKAIKQQLINDTKIKFSYKQSPGLCKVIIQGEKLAKEKWIGQLKEAQVSKWDKEKKEVKKTFNIFIQNILEHLLIKDKPSVYLLIHWGGDIVETPTERTRELNLHCKEIINVSPALSPENYKMVEKIFVRTLEDRKKIKELLDELIPKDSKKHQMIKKQDMILSWLPFIIDILTLGDLIKEGDDKKIFNHIESLKKTVPAIDDINKGQDNIEIKNEEKLKNFLNNIDDILKNPPKGSQDIYNRLKLDDFSIDNWLGDFAESLIE